jgi:3-oxoacyl-[acyl-carrier-protein] synthase-1
MFVIATGMVCPVGLNASAACAALRAGINQFRELPYHDNEDQPIVGAAVPGLAHDLKRGQRLVELLAGAIVDCVRDVTASWQRVPLLVALAEPNRPGNDPHGASAILETVQDKVGIHFHPQLSRVFLQGHTAGFSALRVARELTQDPDVPGCLVCGVDSYINASSLLWLHDNWRLKTEENSDGVIPGEAAASVYVQRRPPQAQPSVAVAGMGFAFEEAGVLTGEPLRGKALAEAARQALAEAGLQMHEVDFRLSDVTGESYGFREQSLAVAGVMRIVRQDLPLWHCADSIGDTGAAAGLCQLVVAFHAFHKRYSPGTKSICFTSGVQGDRAAVVAQYVEA